MPAAVALPRAAHRPVTRKASTRKSVRPAISPLLRRISVPADGAPVNSHLLKSYIAFDALQRGCVTMGLLAHLGEQLLVSQNLCKAGFLKDNEPAVRAAQEALVDVDDAARDSGPICATEGQLRALREALRILDFQLTTALRGDVLQAEMRVLEFVTQQQMKRSRAA